MKNIILIGMTGSGKTAIGELLAKKLNSEFIDGDDYIEKQEGMSLQQIINSKGDGEFLKIEEKRILEIKLNGVILASGGSVVYSDKLMNYLKKKGTLIFLNTPLGIIQKRIENNIVNRGIVGLKTKSLEQLFEERSPLYKKYADIVIDCSEKIPKEIVKEILQKVT